jgi:hypothetical protein
MFTDPNRRIVDFHGDRSYVRKVYRGESGCFLAIDKGEIVVEMDSLENVVVFVPFAGPTSSHGVLEIHGLIRETKGITNTDIFKRQEDILRSMIGNRDYR